MNQRELAERLLALHRPGEPLVLVNAWDAASARVIVSAGAPAIATSSAAAAFALGYPDGQRISRDEMLVSVAVVTRAVDVPVTADMEAGYGDSPGDAAATAHGVIAAGAVGLNVEDTADAGGLLMVGEFVQKIVAIRGVADQAGVPLVLNARVDVFLAEIGEPGDRLEHAIDRGRAYREAGADCVFVPGVEDESTIGALVHGIGGCVSVLASSKTPTLVELARLEVARVSMGSGPYRVALSHAHHLADEAYGMGTFGNLADAYLTHGDVQSLMI
jgi:2-methylisocitrate lyase-like PEP mutase family enzyme